MFDCISVMITVLAGADPRMMLSLDTSGVKSRLISSGPRLQGNELRDDLVLGVGLFQLEQGSGCSWCALRGRDDFHDFAGLHRGDLFTSSTDSNTL